MDSLKIAFYTDTYTPAVDGVVTSINNFAGELEKRGHKVYIFTAGKHGSDAGNGMNVFFARGIRFRKYPQYTLAMFPIMSAAKAKGLDVDIVHVHTPFTMGMAGLVASKVNKIPLLGSFHTLFTDSSVIRDYIGENHLVERVITKYSWSYARFFYNKCNLVTAPSRSIEALLHRKRIDNTVVVQNGVDTRLFNPRVSGAAVRRRLVGKSGRKVVMYVGRISKEKRLDVMIRAARRLRGKGVMFAVVGAGPASDYYARMVSRYGIGDSFKFLGFVENRRLPEYYAASDAFCIPSTFETQGIVAQEAMACGKPVVGADYLALSELIRDGYNGEKFRPNNPVDCARKIEKVINSADRYKGMAATAGNYSIERTTDRLLKVYKDLMH